MSPFSHFLHELRLRHQIRQAELAELLGYEQSYISALEIGAKGPPTEEFVEISHTGRVPPGSRPSTVANFALAT